MKNDDLNFKDSEFEISSRKKHNIKVNLNENKQEMKIIIPFNDIKNENLTLSEDKSYYLLYIKPSFKHPDYPSIEIELKLAIKRETIDKEKLPLEEIVRRALNEGDIFRSHFSPNYDGRLRGVYYGGTF